MNDPIWRKVVCIGGMVLGSLGLITGLTAVAGWGGNEQTQTSLTRIVEAFKQQAPPEFVEAQREMLRKVDEVQGRYRPVNLALLGVQLCVAALLLAGGILMLKRKVSAKLLMAAFAAAILFEVVRQVAAFAVQWELSAIFSSALQRLLRAGVPQRSEPTPAQWQTVDTLARSAMVFSNLIGVYTSVSLAAARIAFYAFGIHVLRRRPLKVSHTGPLMPAEVVG